MICAAPLGMLSDRGTIGRKKFIYLAATMMALSYVVFLVSPLFQTEGVKNPKKMNGPFYVLLGGAAIFGAGTNYKHDASHHCSF